LQSGARTERKKDLYILSLDGGRVFWVVSIALLVLVFLFLLGYWIGHDTVQAGRIAASETGAAGTSAPGDLATLKRDLQLAGQGRSVAGLDERVMTPGDSAPTDKKDPLLQDDKVGTRVQGEQEAEKPRIDETRLTSKSEKREFEVLRTKSKKSSGTTQTAGTTTQHKSQRTARPAAPRETRVDGKYQVQVASFATRSAAESLVSRLKGKQYQTAIVSSTVNGKDFYRVRVGGYDSYDEASRVVANLKSSGDGAGSYIVQR